MRVRARARVSGEVRAAHVAQPAAGVWVAGAVDLDETIYDVLLLRPREEESDDRAELRLVRGRGRGRVRVRARGLGWGLGLG
jgi:hypothetical protein